MIMCANKECGYKRAVEEPATTGASAPMAGADSTAHAE